MASLFRAQERASLAGSMIELLKLYSSGRLTADAERETAAAIKSLADKLAAMPVRPPVPPGFKPGGYNELLLREQARVPEKAEGSPLPPIEDPWP